jgi:ornithine cyclodeaminase
VRAVDTTLGDVVMARHAGRCAPEDIVLSNPFGMAVLDVALAAVILSEARRRKLGHVLPV